MKKQYLIIVILLAIGLAAGYFFGYDHGWEKSLVKHSHEESTDSSEHHSKMHEQIEAVAPIPVVDLLIHQDPKSGWNAQIKLTNFRFAPERVSTVGVDGEGHAHIYVDGVKVNRVYGEWYHLGELEPGMHEISVRLSTNDHKELLSNGTPILDTESLHVPEADESMPMGTHE